MNNPARTSRTMSPPSGPWPGPHTPPAWGSMTSSMISRIHPMSVLPRLSPPARRPVLALSTIPCARGVICGDVLRVDGLPPQPVALRQAQRAAGAAPAAITPSGRPGLPERAPQREAVLHRRVEPPAELADVRHPAGRLERGGPRLGAAVAAGARYRDLLGLVNRRVAARADRVDLLVAGLPLALKAPER